MRKMLAVTLLDVRRLGFGLLTAGLLAGLLPAFASGVGEKMPAVVEVLLFLVLMIVGATVGGSFGNDFTDGRSSFFFARPLATSTLIGGRVLSLVTMSGVAFLAFMASHWLSSGNRSDWTAAVLTRRHIEALGIAWSLSLFASLSIAAHGRGPRNETAWRRFFTIPLRLAASLVAVLVVFGLFAEILLRVYFGGPPTPIRIFFGSWFVAAFAASCVAIAAGRTERLRISRFQNRVMLAHFVLVSVVVVAAWSYLLHPGPDAIQRVAYPTWGSPDGRVAFVATTVDPGGSGWFKPIFVLDIASGQARRLNADQDQGPWTSADGGTMVWSEATPFFFRPVWRYLGGATSFRVRTSSGDVEPLPMPAKLPDFFRAKDFASFGGLVDRVLPSPDGDVFAILWDAHLSFTSRSRGELSEAKLGPGRPRIREAGYLPSGDLRASIVRRDPAGTPSLEFVDIDPKSGTLKTVASMNVPGPARIQFDGKLTRALITSTTQPGRGASISLVDLTPAAESRRSTVLLSDVLFPSAIFLADGRIAATGGGSGEAWGKRILRVFSAAGQMILDVPLGEGLAPRLGGEMFPGTLAVGLSRVDSELSLVDSATGVVLRRVPGLDALSNFSFSIPPPPGSPAARLMQSADGKLYQLPSLTAEPRLLLPLPPR